MTLIKLLFYLFCLLQRSSLHSSDHDHTINKDCVSISDGTGFWYDHTLCSQPLRFICQVCANGKAAPDCTYAQGINIYIQHKYFQLIRKIVPSAIFIFIL